MVVTTSDNVSGASTTWEVSEPSIAKVDFAGCREYGFLMSVAVPFPAVLPAGYEYLADEPAFDPEDHLALEAPSDVLMLSDLGYGAADIEGKATAMAVSAPFRVLSDSGTDVMLDVARRLRSFAKPAGARIENVVRGGCYRSRWLRDLCISPELTEHLASIFGVDVAPHAMPLHLGHLNYEPSKAEVAVDKWHHDTLPLDFVLMVTDPAATVGGRFEYFNGTKDEAADLAANGEVPPRDRVVAPQIPGAGYAVALHGDMVVHRAAPLTELSERITMVNGYVATDPSVEGQSRSQDLIVIDDHEVLWAEWAKFAAWRSRERLGRLIEDLAFTPDRDAVVRQLEAAIADAQTAVAEMRAGEKEAAHYGG